MGASEGEDPGVGARHGAGAARGLRSTRGARATALQRSGRARPGVRCPLPVRGDSRPAAGDRRRSRRSRRLEADGPSRLRRRRLREDRGGVARGVGSRAGGEAGGGSGADDGARPATLRDLPRALRGLPGDDRDALALPLPGRESRSAPPARCRPGRRRDRNAPPAPARCRVQAAGAPHRRRGAPLRSPREGAHP